MEIKGSNTYAANASMPLAATEKSAELAKQPAAQSSAAAVDSVSISDEARALQSVDSGTVQADDIPPGWPPTNPQRPVTQADDIPPGWPPTNPPVED